MAQLLTSWQAWALLGDVFAALTGIVATHGAGHVGADFATLIRTIVAVGALVAVSISSTDKSYKLDIAFTFLLNIYNSKS